MLRVTFKTLEMQNSWTAPAPIADAVVSSGPPKNVPTPKAIVTSGHPSVGTSLSAPDDKVAAQSARTKIACRCGHQCKCKVCLCSGH